VVEELGAKLFVASEATTRSTGIATNESLSPSSCLAQAQAVKLASCEVADRHGHATVCAAAPMCVELGLASAAEAAAAAAAAAARTDRFGLLNLLPFSFRRVAIG
jgi:hypothetical protein